jgi:hypothetical protein
VLLVQAQHLLKERMSLYEREFVRALFAEVLAGVARQPAAQGLGAGLVLRR